jgi:hypothetical protein
MSLKAFIISDKRKRAVEIKADEILTVTTLIGDYKLARIEITNFKGKLEVEVTDYKK